MASATNAITQIKSTPVKGTPTKDAISRAFDSPGNWQHPRLKEINRRRARQIFDERNVRAVAQNVAALIVLLALRSFLGSYGIPTWIASLMKGIKQYIDTLFYLVVLVPVFNIVASCMPLLRPQDDFSDIALTAKQREVLGLPPSSRPPTPGSVIHTPPRYSRTPSLAGSPASYTSSPLSNKGSLNNSSASDQRNNTSFSPMGSPLLHKAVGGVNGARRSSFGSPSGLGASTGTSLFADGQRTPSPAPAKRASIGLTNKWLYEKGRRSSGGPWSPSLQQVRQLQESR